MQKSVQQFIPSFILLLNEVTPAEVSTHDYCNKYLEHLLQHKAYYLRIYAQLLDQLNYYSKKKPAQLSVVDIGTGNGLLGIFAKYCGYKDVYCNDIDPDFLDAAKSLASQLNIIPDGYIKGDIEIVNDFFLNKEINAFVGTDVIEHIYDLDIFIQTIAAINPEAITVFTTASNPEHYFKVRKLQQLQRRDEEVGYTGTDTDSNIHEAFVEIRKKIIAQHFKQLEETTILQLAKASRGLIEKDILKAVHHFNSTGAMPKPADLHNTCHPYTGSWTERILPLHKYEEIYGKNGFSLSIYNGFYDSESAGFKKYMNKLRNFLVRIAGKKISPFIGIVGFKN